MDLWKPWLTLGALSGLLVLGGRFAGGPVGTLIGLGLSLLLLILYLYSDRLALWVTGARPVTREQEPDLYTIVRTLCQRSEMPVPRLYIIESERPGAFATGRSPRKASLAVSRGLLTMLERIELESLLAHELAHIKHRDTFIGSVSAIFSGILSLLARTEGAARWAGGVLLLLLGPIAVALLRLSDPHARDYEADVTASRMIATPRSLIRALQKIGRSTQEEGLGRLFRPEPPLHERIKRLEALV